MAEEDEAFVDVLIPAGEAPLNEDVFKPTGEKAYVLKKQITVYDERGEVIQVIKAGPGTLLMIPREGGSDLNTVPVDKKIKWRVSYDRLHYWLEEKMGYHDQ